VADYRSRPISVVGAVHHPLTFQAMPDTTLLDAIAKAEGTTADAGAEILVTRKEHQPDGAVVDRVQRVALKGLIDSADPALNIQLKGGEQIRVLEGGKLFITGNVKKPGVFGLQDNSETTVLKALAFSEGLLPYSSKLAYIYRHEAGSTKRTEIPIELHEIVQRKSPDVTVYPDDILYVPENKGRRLTGEALDRITGFGSTTASGVLIWRR
jgi:polysaccharide export outer membrane protein